MRIAHYVVPFSTLIFTCAIQSAAAADYMLTPTQEDQQWLLPKVVPSPADNPTTPEKLHSANRSSSTRACHPLVTSRVRVAISHNLVGLTG